MAKITEAALEKALVAWVKEKGGTALKGATNFDTGFPDRVIYLPGAHAYVELKGTSSSYTLTEKQKVWAGRIIASKAPYYIIENKEALERFKEMVYYSEQPHSVNMYNLNGFDLVLYINDIEATYEVRSLKDGANKRIASGMLSSSLPDTIYLILKKLEERFPRTFYWDMG